MGLKLRPLIITISTSTLSASPSSQGVLAFWSMLTRMTLCWAENPPCFSSSSEHFVLIILLKVHMIVVHKLSGSVSIFGGIKSSQVNKCACLSIFLPVYDPRNHCNRNLPTITYISLTVEFTTRSFFIRLKPYCSDTCRMRTAQTDTA